MSKLPPKRLAIKMRGASYPIVIGMHMEQELVRTVERQGKRRIAVIADSTTQRLFGKRIAEILRKNDRSVEIISFSSGEHHKNQKTVAALHHALLKKHFGRDSLIIALGGGVVGDVAGFVAATYLRGIPYIQMPTTLLAIIDSSVGGKVGVDTKYGKNLIGAFYQPRAVIGDLSFISSLSQKQIVNGLIEAVKKFITSDKQSIPLTLQFDIEHPLKDPKLLQEIVYRSVKSKARVVMADEEEANERRILNFGHTVGHAIEFVSGYRLPHGFAVAYGMLVEAKISELLGILPAREYRALESTLANFGFVSSSLARYPLKKILQAIKGDKKARKGIPHYVLLKKIGSVYTKGGQYAHPVSERVVKKAWETLI